MFCKLLENVQNHSLDTDPGLLTMNAATLRETQGSWSWTGSLMDTGDTWDTGDTGHWRYWDIGQWRLKTLGH